jgi:hypothetical protein
MKNKKLAIFTLLFVLATQPTKPVAPPSKLLRDQDHVMGCIIVLVTIILAADLTLGYYIEKSNKEKTSDETKEKLKKIESKATLISQLTKETDQTP